MKVERCKGSRDLLPQDMARFRRLEAVFRDCCLSRGYEEIRTPVLEYLHLFTTAGTLTPDMLGRVYSFLDWDGWSGERVVLRPDGTIPTARLYVDNLAEQDLAKLFYVENVFSFEETGQETRERWQCGAELIGGTRPVADVELISLAVEVLSKLGIEAVEIRLSHAGVIKALLSALDLSSQERTEILNQVLEGNVGALAQIKPQAPEAQRALSLFFDLAGRSPAFMKNLKSLSGAALPGLGPGLDDFIGIAQMLDSLGYSYQADLASGRDFEYYTGLIFQLFVGGAKVGGGGRYDDLIPLVGGRNIPASGFALYAHQLMDLLGTEGLPARRRVLVKAESGGAQELRSCFDIAGRLREARCVAELDLGGRREADFRWVLSVRAEAAPLLLSDRVAGERFEIASAAEVLKILDERCN
ncbi:MAG: HisS family protein [Dehalococcoidia bacterium]